MSDDRTGEERAMDSAWGRLKAPERIPKVGDHILDPHDLWIVELEDDFAKVRDEEGFTLRYRLDRLSWDESAGRWAVIEDVDPETDEQPGREGWPEFNGAFR